MTHNKISDQLWGKRWLLYETMWQRGSTYLSRIVVNTRKIIVVKSFNLKRFDICISYFFSAFYIWNYLRYINACAGCTFILRASFIGIPLRQAFSRTSSWTCSACHFAPFDSGHSLVRQEEANKKFPSNRLQANHYLQQMSIHQFTTSHQNAYPAGAQMPNPYNVM